MKTFCRKFIEIPSLENDYSINKTCLADLFNHLLKYECLYDINTIMKNNKQCKFIN